MNDIVARVYELIAKSGITKKELSKQIGVAKNTIQNWKKADAYPSITLIEKICEAFNITVEQFFDGMGRTDEKKDEDKFLDEWRMLSDTQKTAVINVIHAFKELRKGGAK